MFSFSTARLSLSQLVPADAPFLLELLNTPGWVKYIGERNVRTVEAAEAYVRNSPMQRFSEQGFGGYVCRLKENSTPIGLCTLIKRDSLPDTDIGFAFLPEFNGQGYAEEGATALLKFARETLGLNRIVAITVPYNAASIRLLEKLGLQLVRSMTEPGKTEELLLFATETTDD